MAMSDGENAAGKAAEKDGSALQRGLDALLPPGHLKVVGFLIPSEKMTDELIGWYENEHSVTARFLWPHMCRYQRNFIMKSELGDPPLYKVITEFAWKSEKDKQAARALYSTSAAQASVNEVLPPFIIQPFPRKSYFMVPVEERIVKANPHPSRPDEPRSRQIILLRCGLGESLATFEEAALAYAGELAALDPGVGVIVDFRRDAATTPSPADAVIFIDNPPDGPLPPSRGDAFEIVHIFDVEALRSPIPE